MNSLPAVRTLFAIAALYDGLLGLVFLAAAPRVFAHCGITPPNHWGYVQFPAGLLLVFGMMFLAISLRPVANRNLIPYGMLLKVCYAGTVSWHWAQTGVPDMWKPFAIADVIFLFLFIWAYGKVAEALRQG